MGHEKDAEALGAVEPSQKGDTLRLVAQVEMGGGFVEHEETRALGERAREHHPLALASGQAIQRLAGERLDPRERHRLAGDLEVFPALEEAARGVRETTHEDELLDRVRKGVRDVLGHDGDLPGDRSPPKP